MKKKFMLGFIGLLMLVSLFSVTALGTKNICLNEGDRLYLSDCNVAMDDYICDVTTCRICVNEIRTGVFCQTDPGNCEAECEYLYDEPENPVIQTPIEDPTTVVIIKPDVGYSLDTSAEVTFSFKVTRFIFETCELVIDGEAVASKARPIAYNKQYDLRSTIGAGEHSWSIYCTRLPNDGGDIYTSETRTVTVGEIDNAELVSLTSPAEAYSIPDEGNITFGFHLARTTGITSCNLILNGVSTPATMAIDNTITQLVPVGSYTWKVECVKNGETLSSGTRTLTVGSAPAPASGGSSGGGGGGGGGSSALTINLNSDQLTAGAMRTLTKGSKFKFTFSNESHQVLIDEVNSTGVKVTVSSTPQTFSLNIGSEKKVDLNGDGTYDLSVKLEKIYGNKADIRVKQESGILLGSSSTGSNSEEESTSETANEGQTGLAGITGAVVGTVKNNKIPIAIGFVIVVAMAGLVSFNMQKKKADK